VRQIAPPEVGATTLTGDQFRALMHELVGAQENTHEMAEAMGVHWSEIGKAMRGCEGPLALAMGYAYRLKVLGLPWRYREVALMPSADGKSFDFAKSDAEALRARL
jgi:hypothetical protein